MGILIKYILKNILEKKFRTFLIVIAITCSAALFFASNAIAGTMAVMYEEQMRMQTGQAALLIRPGDHSPSPRFRLAADPVEGVALTAGEVSMGGMYTVPRNGGDSAQAQTAQLHIRGFHLDDRAIGHLHVDEMVIGMDVFFHHMSPQASALLRGL